jgi:hypothetical protein
MKACEPHHRAWRAKANHFYALYRNYSDWRQNLRTATPRGQDELRWQAKREWGAELFIPWTFSVVETILPRMLAQRPSMLVLPGDPDSEDNAPNMKYLIDRQQAQIDYELILQEVVKNALIYGLGIQKTFWKTDWRKRRRLIASEAPQADRPPSGFAVATTLERVFDDPDAASVDPFDFFYDPYAGSDLQDCDYVIHRTWRTMRYIQKMVESGTWRANPDDISRLGENTRKWEEIWNERKAADGLTSSQGQGRGLHEVLEFHDGDQVIVVLDRELVVQAGENPYWHGTFPFQCYRPTLLPGQIYGVGEVEPIEDLQEEINTLRSQRRDNATLVLQKVFAYMEGMVEPNDLKFAPGNAIKVTGDPRELLFPIPTGDIPYSGYQEEDRLGADFERTTGIGEPITGTSLTPGQTATGVQLVQAAASERIRLKSRRAEVELAKAGCKQFGALNQQRILTNRDVRIEQPPTLNEPERRWSWKTLGPLELAGNFDYECEGGSMQPANIVQDSQEANLLWTMFANDPNVDQQKLVLECLRKFQIKRPESWIRPPQPTVPPATLDIIAEQLAQNGFNPDQAKALVAQSLSAALKGGGSGPPPPGGQPPSQNGNSTPAPAPAGGAQ